GAASALLLSRHPHPATPSCQLMRHGDRPAVASDAQSLTDAQRAQLVAERARLSQLLDKYEDAMEHGEGCRMGLVKYRLELLRSDEKLSRCSYERAHLRRQIAHLEELRARMLTGYGETQGPAGHDE